MIVTSLGLPFEIYELSKAVTIIKIILFVLNLLLVAYLVYTGRLFGARGGKEAYEAGGCARTRCWTGQTRQPRPGARPPVPPGFYAAVRRAGAGQRRPSQRKPSQRRPSGATRDRQAAARPVPA
jgi:hypothetical protein